MTINVAGQAEHWDDFRVELWWYQTMAPMGMMGTMGTRLIIYAPMSMATMAMTPVGMTPVGMTTTGGIVGFLDMASGLPWASNLAFGDIIGPTSSMVNWAYLYGSGQFGEDGGYIGLLMDNGSFGCLFMSGQSNIGTSTHSVTFNGWAYEDQPGTPIGAGVIPVPAAIVLGGLGTAVVAWLRIRRTV